MIAAASPRVPETPQKKKTKAKTPEKSPVQHCRDPITLDDLGSWTWDFRAAEAATPPVSCGGSSSSSKNSGGTSTGSWGGGPGRGGKKKKGGSGKGRSGTGGGGSGGGGKGGSGNKAPVSSNAVVRYNVESLVLYLLESGDFQVCLACLC